VENVREEAVSWNRDWSVEGAGNDGRSVDVLSREVDVEGLGVRREMLLNARDREIDEDKDGAILEAIGVWTVSRRIVLNALVIESVSFA